MARKREDNLIPFTSEQSREEAKKNGAKGGIASGKARRKKADLRKAMQEALLQTWSDNKGNKKTGQEIAISGILANLSDPKARNWGKAVEIMMTLTGISLTPEQVAKIKAETALTKAKTKSLERNSGSMADIEDLSALADMLKGDDDGNNQDTNN